jgi:CheY-like chemotaxis protein
MKKVLLVSGYISFLTRNSNLLRNRDFQIFTANSGGEALKLHKAHCFDLILVDFKLEEMGGCTLCSLIRKGEDSPLVPIIITCHNLPGSIERVAECGASSMLLKPIEPITIVEAINGFLDFPLIRSRRVVLKVNVLSKAYEEEFFCFSHDLSNTGILIETDYQLAIGSRITCKFTLENICDIEAEGEVTRMMTGSECENLYGVKFIELPLSSHNNIDKYILAIEAPAKLNRVEQLTNMSS